MKNIHAILLFIPGAMLIASCIHRSEAAKSMDTETIPVKVMNLDRHNELTSVSVSGQFTTDDEVNLSFKTGGVINRIYVKEGDAIKKGQLLATLNLTEIDAQVQQAKLGYEKATRDYQRITNLYNDSVATLEQLQNSKTALELSKQQLNAATFNRTYSEIHAPENGFVLHKMANEGQVMSSGTAVFQTNGAKSTGWLLRVGVSDKNWSAIHLNDKAVINISSNDKDYSGIVARRSEGVDPVTGSFTIDIKLTGDKPAAIASGMFGKAIIDVANSKTNTANNCWAIPYDAILDGDGSTAYVFVTDDNKTARKVKVTISAIEKDKVIISDGLQTAKELIISGSAYLTESSAIRVIQ